MNLHNTRTVLNLINSGKTVAPAKAAKKKPAAKKAAAKKSSNKKKK